MTEQPKSVEIKMSAIDGLGVFATETIPAGTCLGTYTGVSYTRKEFLEKYGKDYRYCYFTNFSWLPIVCAKEERHFMTYINEGETPNVELKRYKLYALKDIVQGEELLLKYPTTYKRTWAKYYK